MENISDSKNNSTYGQIRCPHCGSSYIEFVTEYHKCVAMRVLCIIFAVIFVFVFVSHLFSMPTGENREVSISLMCISGFFFAAFMIAIWIKESKTHVQGVCRDCGHIWLLN